MTMVLLALDSYLLLPLYLKRYQLLKVHNVGHSVSCLKSNLLLLYPIACIFMLSLLVCCVFYLVCAYQPTHSQNLFCFVTYVFASGMITVYSLLLMILSLFQHLAASKGNEDIVKFLLQKEARVSITGKPPHFPMSHSLSLSVTL